MKKIIAIVFAILCVSANVMAEPISLPSGTPLYFQLNNIEQVDTTLSDSIDVPGPYGLTGYWGLVNISTIQNGAVSVPHIDIGGGPVFFSDDGPGGTQGQITGIFYNIQMTSGTTATGGILDLYWYDAGSDPITATCLSGSTCSPDAAAVALFTGGTFLARLNLASGIITGDPVTSIQMSTDITVSLSGRIDCFANVDTTVIGPWTNALNGDWFWVDPDGDGLYGEIGETRDLRFSSFFNGLSSWSIPTAGIQGFRSNDPMRVLTSVPPICGDSIVGNTPGETCDPPGSVPNPTYPNNTCRESCTYCGDGIVNNGEICDFNEPGTPSNCNTACTFELFGGCRMTGGNNTVSPDGEVTYVLGTYATAKNVVKINNKTTEFKYTVGGQVGAPQAGCIDAPDSQFGEWEHNHHENGVLKFSFHAGTHSAPDDAYIHCIACSDPYWCTQARCAPFKQIFWEGTGVFKNAKNNNAPIKLNSCTIDPWANPQDNGYTLHYYKAHVGDFSEPGNTGNQKTYDPNICHWDKTGGVDIENTNLMTPQPPMPDPKFPQFFDKGGMLCDACPDWYEIEIHCTANPNSPIIYRAAGWITGGNFQIHPEVGSNCFDTFPKPE